MNDFTCKRCGCCCGLVPWEKSEYKNVMRIAKKMRVTFVKEQVKERTIYFVRSIVKKAKHGIDSMNPRDMICPFLERDGNGKTSCRVYDYRPRVCRKFGVDGHESALLQCPYQDKPLSAEKETLK